MATTTTLPEAARSRGIDRTHDSDGQPPENTAARKRRAKSVDCWRRRPHEEDLPEDAQPDVVGEASRDSFPASDAPGWTGVALG